MYVPETRTGCRRSQMTVQQKAGKGDAVSFGLGSGEGSPERLQTVPWIGAEVSVTVRRIPSASVVCGEPVSVGMPVPKRDVNRPAPQIPKRGKDSFGPLPDRTTLVHSSSGNAVNPRGF